MKVILIDKVYNKETFKNVEGDLEGAFSNEVVSYDVKQCLKGSVRLVIEYSPDGNLEENK